MPVSTTDLGGMGNGLGLPIANPLYGPGNAAVMGQQAFQQNMAESQANTGFVNAQANRSNQMLPYDISQSQALTRSTNAKAQEEEFQNKVNDALGPDTAANQKRYAIQQAGLDLNDSRRKQMEQFGMLNAERISKLPPDQQDAEWEQAARTAGLAPGSGKVWGDIQRGYSKPEEKTDMGPVGKSGGGASFGDFLYKKNNPQLVQAGMEIAGRERVAELTTNTEKEIAIAKMQLERDLKDKEIAADPEKTASVLTQKYFEMLDKDPAQAKQYADQIETYMKQKGYYAQLSAFVRTAYNPLNPALQKLSQKMGGGPNPGEPAAGVQPPPGTVPGTPRVDQSAAPAAPAATPKYPPPPPGRVNVLSPDGKLYHLPLEQVAEAAKQGYKVVQ